MNYKRVFSKSKAVDLVKMGNELMFIDPDKYYPDKIIYVFKLTPKLIKDMKTLHYTYNN